MENINLIDTFSEFKELKNIDRATMISVLEDVFRSMLLKIYGTDENFDVIINIDKGDFEIWRNREVVEDGAVEDPNPSELCFLDGYCMDVVWCLQHEHMQQKVNKELSKFEKNHMKDKFYAHYA